MKPRIGLFGIMQELYDEMIPGITETQAAWLAVGGTHHMVMNLRHHAALWKAFCALNHIEYVEV